MSDYYRLHNSYHAASLMVLDKFCSNHCVNGELVHEDDIDFEVLEYDDDEFEDFDEYGGISENEIFDEMGQNQEYNYESFVFDRGR